MGLIMRIIPMLLLIAGVVIGVRWSIHYFKNIVPIKNADNARKEKIESEYREAISTMNEIRRKFLNVESNDAVEIEAPSFRDMKIPQVSTFFKAQKEFNTKWYGIETKNPDLVEKYKFAEHVNKYNNYFKEYIEEVIRIDKPSKRFRDSVLPSESLFD